MHGPSTIKVGLWLINTLSLQGMPVLGAVCAIDDGNRRFRLQTLVQQHIEPAVRSKLYVIDI